VLQSTQAIWLDLSINPTVLAIIGICEFLTWL